jgi:hypothetical protein
LELKISLNSFAVTGIFASEYSPSFFGSAAAKITPSFVQQSERKSTWKLGGLRTPDAIQGQGKSAKKMDDEKGLTRGLDGT